MPESVPAFLPQRITGFSGKRRRVRVRVRVRVQIRVRVRIRRGT
jgi:hypothetical protein